MSISITLKQQLDHVPRNFIKLHKPQHAGFHPSHLPEVKWKNSQVFDTGVWKKCIQSLWHTHTHVYIHTFICICIKLCTRIWLTYQMAKKHCIIACIVNFLWRKHSTHDKTKASHLEPFCEKRVAEVFTFTKRFGRFKGFRMHHELIVTYCDCFNSFWVLFFTSNSLWQGPSLHVSSFRAFQTIFASKSAKVAVDFKGALFLVQIITSKGGFLRVAVYSVLMGLVRFRVIINNGCSSCPSVSFGFLTFNQPCNTKQHTKSKDNNMFFLRVLLFFRPNHLSHFTNLRTPMKFSNLGYFSTRRKPGTKTWKTPEVNKILTWRETAVADQHRFLGGHLMDGFFHLIRVHLIAFRLVGFRLQLNGVMLEDRYPKIVKPPNWSFTGEPQSSSRVASYVPSQPPL